MPKLCSETAHPIIALLHITIKIGVVFLYLALPLLTSQMNEMALLMVAGAIDFYFTKNISGRKLVGMRWEIEVSPDGREMLRFESKMDERAIPLGNQTVFWYPFYIFFLTWIVLLVLSIIPVLFWPHIFMTAYQFILLRYNYIYFKQCFNTRSLHVEKLINQHGPDTLLQYHRGTITSRIHSDAKEDR
jgi:hypothetical protein